MSDSPLNSQDQKLVNRITNSENNNKSDFVYLPNAKISNQLAIPQQNSLSTSGIVKLPQNFVSPKPLIPTPPIPQNLNSLRRKMNNPESNAAQIYLEQGLAYWAEQKWQETIIACEKAISLNPNLAEAHKILGNALQKANRLPEAIGHYARAIELKPDFAEAYANLGSLHASQKKWEQALLYYEKALALKSDFPGVYRHLAKVWENLGSPQNAKQMLARAEHLDKLNHNLSPQQHFQVAGQYYRKNQLPQALKHYNLAVKLKPNWLDAHQKRAEVAEQMGLWEQATHYYRTILYLQTSFGGAKTSGYRQPQLSASNGTESSQLRLNPASQSNNSNQPNPTGTQLTPTIQQYLRQAQEKPQSPEIQANLGSLYARQKQWDTAIAYYKKAIKLNPNFAGAYRNLARALTRAGQSGAATEYWLRAIELEAQGVKAEEYLQLASNLIQQGKIKSAISCYRRVIQLQPDAVEPYINLGDLFIKVEQPAQAQACYQEGIKYNPHSPQLYYHLGLLLAQNGNWDGAIEQYKKALQLKKDYWQAAHNMGEALSQKKLWSEALPWYRQAIKVNPNFSWSYNNLGNVLLELKNWSEAVKVFCQAIKLKPNFPWAHYNLGEALGKLNQWDEAIKAYEEAAKIQPDLPNVQQKLGNALYRKIEQDKNSALKFLENAIANNPDEIQNYHQAIALDKENLSLYMGLGNALMKHNRIDEAIVAYQMVLQLQPKHLEASVQLGNALLKKDPSIDPKKLIDDLSGSETPPIPTEILESSAITLPTKVPYSDRPKVSIIIPVYNKLEYTAQCLQSIVKNLSDAISPRARREAIAVEIIIVNDCSTDNTQSSLQDIEGLILINNENNLGFIHSCNKGAAKAEGTYLYFLNNDTEIHPDSIESLLEVIEQDEEVGAVGSKLVYPQGSLQEAGGIIWQDASGWNYGRNDNPYDPKYNYLRETDYCSGASLMVKKSAFEALNGFERDFAPAYYEDTDLCFAIRHQLGLKVMYQPKSVITHYEGISSGTSTTSGVKRYQVINSTKFNQKWQKYLNTSAYLPNQGSQNVAKAARKYQGNKTVLVIDSYMPCYDKESGSRRLFQLLKIFKELGYDVIFAPENGIKDEPYVSELQNLQIEVLYTQDGYGVIPEAQIKARLPFIDIAWICRPELNEKYLPIMREQPHIKVIYDTIDLHYLRLKRAWELSPDKDGQKAAEWLDMQAKELKIAHQADLTITVTPVEQSILHQQGISNIAVVPNLHFPYSGENKKFQERHNILFIGSYTHPPNIDAVLWLCEAIMPLVWEKIPEVTVTLLGSNPTEEVMALASDQIQVPGYISDVSSYFLNHRVFVSPLRYGAGMKGKIGQSLEYCLPVISTDIGIEGMNLTPGKNILIANKTERFAEQIIRLYQDEILWEKLAANAKDALLPFTPKAVKNNLLKQLNLLHANAN